MFYDKDKLILEIGGSVEEEISPIKFAILSDTKPTSKTKTLIFKDKIRMMTTSENDSMIEEFWLNYIVDDLEKYIPINNHKMIVRFVISNHFNTSEKINFYYQITRLEDNFEIQRIYIEEDNQVVLHSEAQKIIGGLINNTSTNISMYVELEENKLDMKILYSGEVVNDGISSYKKNVPVIETKKIDLEKYKFTKVFSKQAQRRYFTIIGFFLMILVAIPTLSFIFKDNIKKYLPAKSHVILEKQLKQLKAQNMFLHNEILNIEEEIGILDKELKDFLERKQKLENNFKYTPSKVMIKNLIEQMSPILKLENKNVK